MTRCFFKHLVLFFCTALLLSGCALSRFSDPNASGYRRMEREECVPFAREVSGIQLRGDAHTWWDKAAGVYQRGQYPSPGAMMVLAKTNRLRSGHLAVVNGILGPRDITVTHTNWGDDMLSRRIVYETMRVQDASPDNSWTSARFWNRETGAFGFPYPVQGFIYPTRDSAVMAGAPASMPTAPIMMPAPIMQPPMQPQIIQPQTIMPQAKPAAPKLPAKYRARPIY